MKIINSINNENNPKRDLGDIQALILHHTGTNKSSRNYLNKIDFISAHYLVAKDGTIYYLMGLDRVAYHAGRSTWDGLKTQNYSLNWNSCGIEVESDGKEFTDEQRIATKELICGLMGYFDVKPNLVLRHRDIAPKRKVDIGDKFFNNEFLSWNEYQNSLNPNYLLTLQIMLNLSQESLDTIARDYQPMTEKEMLEKAKEWKCTKDFKKGLKVLTKPTNYKDFRDCITYGRLK